MPRGRPFVEVGAPERGRRQRRGAPGPPKGAGRCGGVFMLHQGGEGLILFDLSPGKGTVAAPSLPLSPWRERRGALVSGIGVFLRRHAPGASRGAFYLEIALFGEGDRGKLRRDAAGDGGSLPAASRGGAPRRFPPSLLERARFGLGLGSPARPRETFFRDVLANPLPSSPPGASPGFPGVPGSTGSG